LDTGACPCGCRAPGGVSLRARGQASRAARCSTPRRITPPLPAAPSAPSTTRSARSARPARPAFALWRRPARGPRARPLQGAHAWTGRARAKPVRRAWCLPAPCAHEARAAPCRCAPHRAGRPSHAPRDGRGLPRPHIDGAERYRAQAEAKVFPARNDACDGGPVDAWRPLRSRSGLPCEIVMTPFAAGGGGYPAQGALGDAPLRPHRRPAPGPRREEQGPAARPAAAESAGLPMADAPRICEGGGTADAACGSRTRTWGLGPAASAQAPAMARAHRDGPRLWHGPGYRCWALLRA
jgi:hypothetical protein